VSLFVVCSLSLVLTTGRSNIFQVFIWCAIFCIYSDLDWFNAKRIAKAVIVIMTLFFLVFFVLGNLVGKSTENSGLEPYWRLPGMSSILTLPYIYISGNIPALDKLISNTLTFSFGQYTFLPFLKLLNKVGFPIVPHSGINEFYEIPFIFNTATYLDVMYMDFGIIGILVIPLLIGFTTTHLFVKMMLNPSFTLVYINSLTTMALLFSFGSSSYIQPSFWFYLLIGPIVGRLVTSRP
jgi:oligosaccharide repeat unit polymerase